MQTHSIPSTIAGTLADLGLTPVADASAETVAVEAKPSANETALLRKSLSAMFTMARFLSKGYKAHTWNKHSGLDERPYNPKAAIGNVANLLEKSRWSSKDKANAAARIKEAVKGLTHLGLTVSIDGDGELTVAAKSGVVLTVKDGQVVQLAGAPAPVPEPSAPKAKGKSKKGGKAKPKAPDAVEVSGDKRTAILNQAAAMLEKSSDEATMTAVLRIMAAVN